MSMLAAHAHGKGFLLRWPAQPDAGSGYTISWAREPSPNFYELISALCCPLLADGTRPCCPVMGSTLQIDQIHDRLPFEAGHRYRFRATARGSTHAASDAANLTSGWVAANRLPSAPGLPMLRPVADDAGALYDVSWSPPIDDGGDIVRGYRLWANISTLNATGVVLVANVSASRPAGNAMLPAHAAHLALPLLPAHHYALAVQAFNTVGGGPLGPAATVATPIGTFAGYELPIGRWRRGRLGRGGIARHRTFVPEGCEWMRVVVQQAADEGGGYISASTLRERQRQRDQRQLVLYSRAGTAPEPPRHPVPVPTPRRFSGADSAGEAVPQMWSREATHTNASASAGELSIASNQPNSGWHYLLVHAVAVADDGAAYDVRVEVRSGAANAAVDERTRRAELAQTWRYRVDPDGHTDLGPWVVARHVHPAS